MIRAIAKVIRVINSESSPGQVSLGLCFSLIVAFTPLVSLHNLLLLLLVLLFRVNLSAFILGLIVFSGVAYLLDPLFHIVGLAVLTVPSLEQLWTTFYNSTIWRVEYFNNTIVMGGLLTALVLFFPAFFIFNFTIRMYRKHLLSRVQKTKLVQAIKASKVYRIYQSVSGWGVSS